jgi:hypothetical protein
MGIFDDISYGLGISDSKPSGYDERTANTIEKNQGSAAADRYRDEKGIGSGSFSSPSDELGGASYTPLPAPTTLASYGPKPDFFRDANLDRRIGYRNLLSFGQPLEPFGEGDDRVTQEMIDAYNKRTAFAKSRADQDFMGTGLTQQQYADGQQYGFTTGADGQMSVSSGDRGPAPTITDPNAPNSTDFDPNNAFLRNRMRMQQEQGGGILPPAGGAQPTPPAPPPLQMPMLPAPQMPPQLRGIMGLSDRSNISPAMRYAAENYYRLGGRQMMNDEFERGRAMVQGQGV